MTRDNPVKVRTWGREAEISCGIVIDGIVTEEDCR